MVYTHDLKSCLVRDVGSTPTSGTKVKNSLSKNYFVWAIPIFIFILVFSLSLLLRLSTDSFSSGNDPYYHVKKSFNLTSSTPSYPPAFSLQSDKPTDLYIAYHRGMMPFISDFNGSNFEVLIKGSKIYHSIILALLFSVFFIVLKSILKKEKSSRPQAYALLGTILLFTSSHIFAFRIFMERPHVLSILFMILALYACIDKNKFFILLLSALFPFFYSVSFFILILPIVYVFASIVYGEDILNSFKILVSSIVGLVVGIILRPDTVNYLANGYIVHINSLKETIFGSTTNTPAELSTPLDNLSREVWLILFLFYFVSLAFYIVKKRSIHKLSLVSWFLFALSVIFTFGFLVVQRTVEYTLPFFIIAFFVGLGTISHSLRESLRNLKQNTLAREVFSTIAKKIRLNKKTVGAVFLIFISLLFYSRISNLKNTFQKSPNYKTYQSVTEEIRRLTPSGSTIFIPRFGMFPELYFYASDYRFTSGMDPAFTYAHSPEIFWKIYHTSRGENICDKKICTKNEIDVFDFIISELGSEYIVLNTKYFNKDSGSENFKALIEKDSRFKLVFTDPKFSNIKLYKLEPIAD